MATMAEASTIAERVARGVAWLDANDPDWWKEDQPGRGDDGGPIDLGYLDMARPCRCVLGQRWGNYYRAPITLDEAVTLGFDTSVPDDFGAEFAELEAEWVRVITERREAAR